MTINTTIEPLDEFLVRVGTALSDDWHLSFVGPLPGYRLSREQADLVHQTLAATRAAAGSPTNPVLARHLEAVRLTCEFLAGATEAAAN